METSWFLVEGIGVEHMGITYLNDVGLLTLKKGVIHSISLDMLREFETCLDEIESSDQAKTVVLTGDNEKFFCIGFDLPTVIPMDMDAFREFYTLFWDVCLRLFAFPKPTLCALRGHATAGGCIISLCCDFRWIAEGRRLMGLNEIQLNAPVPFIADQLMARLCGDAHTRRLIYSGSFCNPEDALELGLVDRVLPGTELIPAAVEEMQRLAAMHAPSLAYDKRSRVRDLLAHLRARMDDDIREFVQFWYDPKAREGLEEAVKKF